MKANAIRKAAHIRTIICEYLGKCDASTGALVEHCECSEMTVRRALGDLRRVGAPIHKLRHAENGNTAYYWSLDRKLTDKEIGAYLGLIFFPEKVAQALYNHVNPAGDTP